MACLTKITVKSIILNEIMMLTSINSPIPLLQGMQSKTVIFPTNASSVLISHIHRHYVLPDNFSNFSEKRKCEFLAGRYCAIQCLEKLGVYNPELPISSSRHPIWPKGYVGSISHTENIASAVVVSTDDYQGIGIDTEHLMKHELALELADQILTQKEKENFSVNLMGQDQLSEFLSLVFSGKESIFKCYQPITQKNFYFHDAEITSIDHHKKVFQFKLLIDLNKQYKKGYENHGHYEFKPDSVSTTVLVKNTKVLQTDDGRKTAKFHHRAASNEFKAIKCVVWDLDNTVWDGVLLEDGAVNLKINVVNTIKEIDSRGILQSIASKNHYQTAMDKLKAFGIEKYFLFPQVSWNPKSESLVQIGEKLNISLDTLLFVDDSEFELNEVKFMHPEVSCINSLTIDELLSLPRMNPRYITSESKMRREYYMADIHRSETERNFEGDNIEFIKSLAPELEIRVAKVEDLQRAEELTQRTNQLNTTGYTYSYDELNSFINDPRKILLVAKLKDKFGDFGTIGLALIDIQDDCWVIKLLLMSCRVMSRGAGTVFMAYIFDQCKKANRRLLSEFLLTGRNEQMFITYKFSGFEEIENNNGFILFEKNLDRIPKIPSYYKLIAPEKKV